MIDYSDPKQYVIQVAKDIKYYNNVKNNLVQYLVERNKASKIADRLTGQQIILITKEISNLTTFIDSLKRMIGFSDNIPL